MSTTIDGTAASMRDLRLAVRVTGVAVRGAICADERNRELLRAD